jgi:heme-degrading monooxygenase HmoA
MIARVTVFELDPLRFDLDAALERFREAIVPELHEQPGFEGVYVLANDDAKGLVLTFWASADDAEAGIDGGFWSAQVAQFATLFAAAPGRAAYDVVYAETPFVAAG